MIAPNLPSNEKQRQTAVEKYQLLDTLPEENYDSITKLMASICDVPISLITLLDKERNFLKSHHGIPFSESPREISFCGHAINSEDPITIIEDSREDKRFEGNPLVTEHNAIFYAGAPLVDSNGYKLGTLCVYDTKPRKINEQQKEALISLSKQVVNLFEQRYQNFKLEEAKENLKNRNDNLKKFAAIVSHDLKSPLANIVLLTELLESENKNNFSKDSIEYLDILKESSLSLSAYIEGMLDFYRSDDVTKEKHTDFLLADIVSEIQRMCPHQDSSVKINIPDDDILISANEAALTQILFNLVANAIKYNDKGNVLIDINIKETDNHYYFSVTDNGIGIETEKLKVIFDLFKTLGVKDRFGNAGTGIGLATIKKIITTLGGDISVTSKVNQGSVFSFNLPKVHNFD